MTVFIPFWKQWRLFCYTSYVWLFSTRLDIKLATATWPASWSCMSTSQSKTSSVKSKASPALEYASPVYDKERNNYHVSSGHFVQHQVRPRRPPKVTSPKKKRRSFLKREIGGTVIATSPQDTHRQQLMVMRTVYNFTKLALRKWVGLAPSLTSSHLSYSKKIENQTRRRWRVFVPLPFVSLCHV